MKIYDRCVVWSLTIFKTPNSLLRKNTKELSDSKLCQYNSAKTSGFCANIHSRLIYFRLIEVQTSKDIINIEEVTEVV